jgi:hypothetical protein
MVTSEIEHKTAARARPIAYQYESWSPIPHSPLVYNAVDVAGFSGSTEMQREVHWNVTERK